MPYSRTETQEHLSVGDLAPGMKFTNGTRTVCYMPQKTNLAKNLAKTTRTTTTMKRPIVSINELKAEMFPDNKTGYKDALDPCNKANKSYGGEIKPYESLYASDFCEPKDTRVKLRQDGVPISPQRTGKALMATRKPSMYDLHKGKLISAKYSRTSIVLGDERSKDPNAYRTVGSLFYRRHHRTLPEANPGIASDAAKRAHKKIGL